MSDHFRAAVREWAGGNSAAVRTLADGPVRTVVLVEGVSDQSAVEALATMCGRDLASDGVCVLPIDGAMGAAKYLRLFRGLGLSVRGLCDEAEEGYFQRGAEQAGYGIGLSRADMESLGFFVCVQDLEDELIRAHGFDGIERVLAAGGDLARFRLFQKQPVQRSWTLPRQLRRFMGTTSGRKARYAQAMVLALEPDRVPRPLAALLNRV
jgi:hypothetical protein